VVLWAVFVWLGFKNKKLKHKILTGENTRLQDKISNSGVARDLPRPAVGIYCLMFSIGHRSSGMRDNMDPEDRDGLGNPLPPIPVPDSTLGSPYENVRATRGGSRISHSGGGGMDSSSPSTSPTHWEFYHSNKAHQGSSGDPTSV